MILAQAEKIPPFVCRLVARKKNGWKPMSMADIAKKARLSKSYVATLSSKTSWEGIAIDVIDRFSSACGVDLMKPYATIDFLKTSQMVFIQNCTATQKKFFVKLFKISPQKK